MAAGVTWDGLDAYQQLLASFPEEMAAEAARTIETDAAQVATDIRGAYPVRTGRLRDGVVVRELRGDLRAGAVIQNTAPYALVFDRGSQGRHTAIGANRGPMPPGHVFLPRTQQWRQRTREVLMDLLRRAGATQVIDGG